MIAIRYSWFFIPISPISGFWQLKTSNSIWSAVIWYPFPVHALFVYAFLFCWSCDLFKGKLLKQAYAYESVLITGLWQVSHLVEYKYWHERSYIEKIKKYLSLCKLLKLLIINKTNWAFELGRSVICILSFIFLPYVYLFFFFFFFFFFF